MDTFNTDYSALETSVNSSLFVPLLLLGLFLGILYIAGSWKVYKKANVPGWGTLVPFYSQYLYAKISLGNGWFFLLLLIPFVNVVVMILMSLQLANAFGKGTLFGLGLIFFPYIFVLILGFGKAEYQRIEK